MEGKIEQFRMFYQDQGEGLPVILIHGFPLDRTIWDAVTPVLAREAHVITPDLRGHGKSQSTKGTYSMSLLADDIRILMDTMGIERAVIAGHSMGGYVCLAFARDFPDRLLGLGLVATQAYADTPERKNIRYENAEEVRQHGVGFLAESLPKRYTADPQNQAAVRKMIMNTSADGVIGALLGMAERPDATPYLSDIHVPVVVFAGSQDELIPPAKTLDICAHLPQASCIEIPGSQHMLMMENPRRVAEGMLDLIRAVKRAENNPVG